MKTVTWDSKLVNFLSNQNTVIIKNEEEFEQFTKRMNTVGLDPRILKPGMELTNNELLVEYNNNKGFTFWNYNKLLSDAIQESYDWYGIEPLELKDIL